MNFRPAVENTPGFRPQAPDPGALDFLYTNAYNALYHSPFAGTYRFSELTLEKVWGTGKKLTPEQANDEFGMDGLLQFNSPIYESAARLMMRRKIAEQQRAQVIGAGIEHGGAARTALGFGTSFVASFIDPINFAASFVPIVGQAKFVNQLHAGGAASWRVKLAQGLIDESTITKFVGPSVTKQRLVTGAIEGSVGAALVEPLVLFPALQEQSDYSLQDTLINLGFGAVFGAGIHAGIGKLGDYWSKRNGKTQEAAINGTIKNILDDEPVTAPAKFDAVDERTIAEGLEMPNFRTIAKEKIDSIESFQKSKKYFNTNDPYVYHLSQSKDLASFLEKGMLPSERGIDGPGLYLSNTIENTQQHALLGEGLLFRVKKDLLVNEFGVFPARESGIEFDESTGDLFISGKRILPANILEVQNEVGDWVALNEGALANINKTIAKEKFNDIDIDNFIEVDKILLHSTQENFDKITFDAFFGNQNFTASFGEDFGQNRIFVKIPKNTKILDFTDFNNIEVKKLLIRLNNELFPDQKVSSNNLKSIEEFKKFLEDDLDGYDFWAGNKAEIANIMRDMNIDGLRHNDEYILTKETLAGLKQELKKNLTGEQALNEHKKLINEQAVKGREAAIKKETSRLEKEWLSQNKEPIRQETNSRAKALSQEELAKSQEALQQAPPVQQQPIDAPKARTAEQVDQHLPELTEEIDILTNDLGKLTKAEETLLDELNSFDAQKAESAILRGVSCMTKKL